MVILLKYFCKLSFLFSLNCHITFLALFTLNIWCHYLSTGAAPGINSNYSVLKLPLWNINRQTCVCIVALYTYLPRKRDPFWFITDKKKYYLFSEYRFHNLFPLTHAYWTSVTNQIILRKNPEITMMNLSFLQSINHICMTFMKNDCFIEKKDKKTHCKMSSQSVTYYSSLHYENKSTKLV